MNGNYNNYTLSPFQAKELLRKLEINVTHCITEIESITDGFFLDLAKRWADDNAVLFEKDVRERLYYLITYTLIPGYCKIAYYISSAANKYGKAGGRRINLTYNENISTSILEKQMLQSDFAGHKFGFISGQAYEDAIDLTSLTNLIRNSAEQFMLELRQTNAFGNSEIIMTIVNEENKFYSHLTHIMSAISRNVKKIINFTEANYESIQKNQ